MHITADFVFNMSHIVVFLWLYPKEAVKVMNTETSGDILLALKGQSNSLNIEALVL